MEKRAAFPFVTAEHMAERGAGVLLTVLRRCPRPSPRLRKHGRGPSPCWTRTRLSVLLGGLRDAAEGKDPFWPWSRDFAEVCDLADLDAGRVLLTYEISKAKGWLFKVKG